MNSAAGLAIATTIKAAVKNYDRTAVASIGRRHGGLGRITRLLVVSGYMTVSDRRAALAMNGNKINNPCCRIRVN